MEMVNSEPGILGVHDLMIHNYGPGKLFASVHAEVDSRGSLIEVHDMIDQMEHRIKSTLKIEMVIHMDPVIIDDTQK